MADSTPHTDEADSPRAGGAEGADRAETKDGVFDDPALEAAFGLSGETDWIERARESRRSPTGTLGRLGPYELLEEVGRGAQGVVYKAVQPGMGRTIAIKRFFAVHGLHTGAHRRFTQEVQALVRLHHPSIVTVHGAELIDGSPILLMEHVAGIPIDRWADGPTSGGGRRSVAEVLEAFAQVCDAVLHAHQRGVVHRDLKPSNVLIDESGTPRVFDFGIARVIGEARAGDPRTLTKFVGTPMYAPPEHFEGAAEPDTRTDVYSLGVLLYRLLTGSEPFDRSASLPDLMDAVRRGKVRRPSLVFQALPRDLDWVILKAMSREPKGRYQTVDALCADVHAHMQGRPVSAHPPSSLYTAAKFAKRNRTICAAAGGALVLILGLAGVSIGEAWNLTRRNRDLELAIDREVKARQEAGAERARANAEAEAIDDATAKLADRSNSILSASSVLTSIDKQLSQAPPPKDTGALVQYHTLRARVAMAAKRHNESVEQWTAAIQTAAKIYPPGDARLSVLHRELASDLGDQNRYDDAVKEASLAVESSDARERFRALISLANLQSAARDHTGALASAERLLKEAGEDHANRAKALETLCTVERAAGHYRAARVRAEEAIAELRDVRQPDSWGLARLRVFLAELLLREGRAEEAEAHARLAVKYRLATNGSQSGRTTDALLVHADALARVGRFSEAAQARELAVYRFEGPTGTVSRRAAALRFAIGAAHLGAGAVAEGRRNLAIAVSLGATDDADAEAVAEDVRLCESVLAAAHWQVTRALTSPLGQLAWLVQGAPDAPESEPE